MNSDKKIAVVLFQLGGPDKIESVKPFLYKLFSDPDIINFPGAFLSRKTVAKIISSLRSKRTIENYKLIGGKSPIYDITKTQATALEQELKKDISVDISIAMRYWHPFIYEVIKEIETQTYKNIILLPLYPQYSTVTTGSSLNEWNRLCSFNKLNNTQIHIINSFYNHPKYIDALVDNINKTLNIFHNLQYSNVNLVFSAHSIPLSITMKGDPYKYQIEETVQLVMERGKWELKHTICYQSKVGPIKWLSPSLRETIQKLASQGSKQLLVIPISFVSENIETLYEINIEMRREAEHLGVQQFEMMPALNDSPKFISCLTDLVLSNI